MRTIKEWARLIKRDVVALWIAARDTRTPWYARVLAMTVAAYALSPIDLIPDFIPVIGYLDDMIIVPLGIMLVIAMIPPELMDEFRCKAKEIAERPISKFAPVAVVLIWIVCCVWFIVWHY